VLHIHFAIFGTEISVLLPQPSVFVKNILLGVLYFALGRASLLLSIQPGHAMAVFFPVGLAFGAVLVGGYRLLPGVLAGSFCFCLSVFADPATGLSLTSLLLSLIIGCGASLQALAGVWLIRRFVGYPTALDRPRTIIGLFICIGPLACLINSCLGIAALRGFGMLNNSQLLGNWLIWWTGDALGGVVVTPICLMLIGQSASVWHARRLRVLLPLLITGSVIVLAFLYIRNWEQREFRDEFRETAERIANTLQARLDYHVEIQKSVVSLFASRENVTSREFLRFVEQPAIAYAAVQAIAWAPRVGRDGRSEFEKRLGKEGNNDFAIKEPDHGKMVPAKERDAYFPIICLAPQLGNDMFLGFDLASTPARRQTIQEASDLALPVASEPLSLLQRPHSLPANILISAVFANDLPTMGKKPPQRTVIGLVATVLFVGDALDDLLSEPDKRNMLIELSDERASSAKVYYDNSLAADRKPDGQPQAAQNAGEQDRGRSAPLLVTRLSFAGRELVFSARPSNAYYASHQIFVAWGTLVFGSLFMTLVCMYLLLESGRAYSIEALVTKRTRELHESEQRLHAILDNAAEGILTFDQYQNVVLDNRAARHLLGDPDLLERSFDSLFQQEGQALALPDADDIAAANSQESHIFREVQGVRPDGSRIDLGMSLANLERNQQYLTIAIIHDLTEQKRVERLKGEFVSAVSHELRTPLTSIRGALGLITGGVVGAVPPAMQKLMTVAKENAERLAILVNDILDFEKLEYGGMTFHMENHSLFRLVASALESNQGYAEKFGIRLQSLCQADPGWMVHIDANRLIQILSNLISNAVKFSHPDQGVEVDIVAREKQVRIWVIDHGIGIGADFQKRIFRKFSQEDSAVDRKHVGTGLGLSLSRSMVEKMGGKIGFESVEGQGARFFIELTLLDSA
jgi:PAS domain S-box-containing protein